jgi:hypothetical protein
VGSGTDLATIELEKVANVLKGVTTNYPGAAGGGNPDDWGQPTAFAAAGIQYTMYYLQAIKTETSSTPLEQHASNHIILLAIPSNAGAGTSPDAKIQSLLGT